MKPVRFLMLGGFLGAGKTTALSWLARYYQSRGLTVGVLTNDQAENLVDTHAFRSAGFAAEEIAGGCFCCRFDALVEAASKLSARKRPDVLLAEPVGSCTDLVATVAQPLSRLYADNFEIGPYVVLVDPIRLRKILRGDRMGGFSPKVAYIFHKQMEEADAIALNKIDAITDAERGELDQLLRVHFPQKQVLALSARTADGLPALADFLAQRRSAVRCAVDVDYDVYAEGEAELGWLNSTIALTSPRPFQCDELLLAFARLMQDEMCSAGMEIAHLKAILHTAGHFSQINLVTSQDPPQLTKSSYHRAGEALLILNARAHAGPEELWRIVQNCLEKLGERSGMCAKVEVVQRFRPGRPVPTHRFAEQ